MSTSRLPTATDVTLRGMRLRSFFFIAVLSGLALQPAFADSGDRWERRQEKRDHVEEHLTDKRSGGHLTAHEAARRAQARNGGGRVLGVEAVGDGFRVKLVKEGEVRTFMIPQDGN